MSSSQPDDPTLRAVLSEAQQLGFLGAAPVEVGIQHARGFASGFDAPPGRLVDLGAGGGLPGLVLARLWDDAEVHLVEARERRCAFLRGAVSRLGMEPRVRVIEARAEAVGRWPELRGRCDAVVARGFGRPAVVAECAAPLLRVGGQLVVSEPPAERAETRRDRWSEPGLAELGLALGPGWTTAYHFQSLVQIEACPERYPRRVGVPAKRPLF